MKEWDEKVFVFSYASYAAFKSLHGYDTLRSTKQRVVVHRNLRMYTTKQRSFPKRYSPYMCCDMAKVKFNIFETHWKWKQHKID